MANTIKMRILYINRPKKSWLGGDYIQMERTAEELRKLGVEVDIEDNPLPKPALKMFLYDIIHVWHFSMEWSKYAIWAGVSKKIPTVCSMIYHESERWIPYSFQQLMADSIDGMIFLTEGEKERVKRHIKLNEAKTVIIPNGIDKEWFIKYHHGGYLLTVGRIEPSKGQLSVARVAKELGLKYKCVGEKKDKSYSDQVEAEGAELIEPITDKKVLREVYRGCSIYVCASRAELMPLTVMEAGAQGKQIVLTDHCEWKKPIECGGEYCEWNNEMSIKEAIVKQLSKDENKEFKKVLKDMTWPQVGKDLKTYYESILSHKPTKGCYMPTPELSPEL